MKHRGLFTEEFAVERLTRVFGAATVFPNVDILGSKGNTLGEIDALVLFGDRALVLQAKSKRLTLEARRGNDLQIKDDFRKSIQNSSGQAYLCAQLLEEGTYAFRDAADLPVPSLLLLGLMLGANEATRIFAPHEVGEHRTKGRRE